MAIVLIFYYSACNASIESLYFLLSTNSINSAQIAVININSKHGINNIVWSILSCIY